ncbi:hypothetical protein RchiOBHm_Chr3g0488921 [Rosa chinensis]|uniref:Uncharacterized protein n=1 Tax=Rosa chinensis TaxID=74649 RepID=A0A2P6RFW9_ROSCH|nr:hypothetical protein RchiOBHm_Chr3g0488921 [Rosa chinensis]
MKARIRNPSLSKEMLKGKMEKERGKAEMIAGEGQGIGNPWTVQGLKGLVPLNFPSVIFLSETHCRVTEMTCIRHQLGWSSVFSVPCIFKKKKNGKGVSRSGGLSLLWTEEVELLLRTFLDNHNYVLIGKADDPNRWRFTGVYGYPKVEDRHSGQSCTVWW